MGVQTVDDQDQDGGDHEAPTKTPEARSKRPQGCEHQTSEPDQGLDDPPSHELEQGIQAS
jgi:hypothetical protein